MFYKRAIAFSVAAALMLVGCSKTGSNNEAPASESETALSGEITVYEATDLDVAPTEEEKITINIGLYEGAASLGAAHLLENSTNGIAYENYNPTVYSSDNEIISALEDGKVVAAVLPLNTAARLYNRGERKYKLAMLSSFFNYCIAQNGNILSKENDITSLIGKDIAIAEDDVIGKIVIEKIIKDYNIENCNIKTVATREDLVNGLKDNSIKLALIQEPYLSEATVANQAVTMGIDLYDSWYDKNDADIVTGALVVADNFINQNKKAFVYFLKDYDASVIITRKNIDESSQLAEKYKLSSSAAVAKSAIPGCSISTAKDNKMIESATKYFNLIGSLNPSALGGKIPARDFYYTE